MPTWKTPQYHAKYEFSMKKIVTFIIMENNALEPRNKLCILKRASTANHSSDIINFTLLRLQMCHVSKVLWGWGGDSLTLGGTAGWNSLSGKDVSSTREMKTRLPFDTQIRLLLGSHTSLCVATLLIMTQNGNWLLLVTTGYVLLH